MVSILDLFPVSAVRSNHFGVQRRAVQIEARDARRYRVLAFPPTNGKPIDAGLDAEQQVETIFRPTFCHQVLSAWSSCLCHLIPEG